MGEAAAREAMGALEADGISFKPSRRVNYLSGPMLDFVEDALDSFLCHSAATQLHVGGLEKRPAPAKRGFLCSLPGCSGPSA